MTPAKPAAPARLLTQAAGDRRTGALIVGGLPGGTVYLVEGLITYAESAAAPGVGELLTVSGRLAARTWQAALDTGASRGGAGPLLLAQGHLTQGELELCVLGATYDAAYFALSTAGAPAEFRDGMRHWLGDVTGIDAGALTRECRRRVKLLDGTYPHPRLDSSPVIPVTRPPRERITLTAPQWELLVHADGQRTPADLAQLLGRAGYATVLELRRMAAAGLIEAPPAERQTQDNHDFVRLPRARGESLAARRPTVPGERATVPIVPVAKTAAAPLRPVPAAVSPAPVPVAAAVSPAAAAPPPRSPAPAAPAPPAAPPAASLISASVAPGSTATTTAAPPSVTTAPAPSSSVATASGAPALAATTSGAPALAATTSGAPALVATAEVPNGSRTPRLARRKPGAKLPREIAAETPEPHPAADEMLLKRIRTALRALR